MTTTPVSGLPAPSGPTPASAGPGASDGTETQSGFAAALQGFLTHLLGNDQPGGEPQKSTEASESSADPSASAPVDATTAPGLVALLAGAAGLVSPTQPTPVAVADQPDHGLLAATSPASVTGPAVPGPGAPTGPGPDSAQAVLGQDRASVLTPPQSVPATTPPAPAASTPRATQGQPTSISTPDAALIPQVVSVAPEPSPSARLRTTTRPVDPVPGLGAPSTGPQVAPAPVAAPQSIPMPSPTAPAAAPLADQLGRQFAVLRGAPDGSHSMTVQVTPEHLGPVSVHVKIENGTLDLFLHGAHEHGQAALTQAVPDLRRYLETAGLSCNRVEVSTDTDQSSWFSAQPDAGGYQEEHSSPDRRARSWMSSGDNNDSHPVVVADQSTPSGVDVRM